MRILPAIALLAALAAPVGATTLEDGMAGLAEAVAPQLLDERLRAGVGGPVDLFLLDPADATTGESCAALSDTLLFRMAAAMQEALRQYRRDVASVIWRQRVAEGELAMKLDWVARRPGVLELRPSYGRLRGDTVVGTFMPPVEITTSDLSAAERKCLRNNILTQQEHTDSEFGEIICSGPSYIYFGSDGKIFEVFCDGKIGGNCSEYVLFNTEIRELVLCK